MRYVEHAPIAELAPFVHCLWVFECDFAPGESKDERIVPDGCPELIFHFGEPLCEVGDDGLAKRQTPHFLAGQITRPLVLRSSGKVSVVSVRFTPFGARRFFDLPMREATDRRIALADLWGASAGTFVAHLQAVEGDAARIERIQRELKAQAVKRPDVRNMSVAHCVQALQSEPDSTIESLSALSGLSSRQLERRFLDEVGVSPKLFASLLRFRSLFDALNAETPSPWLKAAIDSGYFDQAHMIRDFKRFAGRPPQAFYANLAGLSAAMVGNAVSDSYKTPAPDLR